MTWGVVMLSKPYLCFFGGFRQADIPNGKNAFRCLREVKPAPIPIVNLWAGRGDSLCLRWMRAENALRGFTSSDKCDYVILGYSMGCHLAVKCAKKLLAKPKTKGRVSKLYLLAPDPKYRRGMWDDLDERAADVCAYSEATSLWNDGSVPGESLATALHDIAAKIKGGIHVAYCEFDPVAEWSGNVELLRPQTNGIVSWTPVPLKGEARCGDLMIRLDSNAILRKTWIHDQIFELAQRY